MPIPNKSFRLAVLAGVFVLGLVAYMWTQVESQQRQTASLRDQDRKSTRLNSSHITISYAVFCLKKKKKEKNQDHMKQRNSTKEKVNHIPRAPHNVRRTSRLPSYTR